MRAELRLVGVACCRCSASKSLCSVAVSCTVNFTHKHVPTLLFFSCSPTQAPHVVYTSCSPVTQRPSSQAPCFTKHMTRPQARRPDQWRPWRRTATRGIAGTARTPVSTRWTRACAAKSTHHCADAIVGPVGRYHGDRTGAGSRRHRTSHRRRASWWAGATVRASGGDPRCWRRSRVVLRPSVLPHSRRSDT